MQITEFGPFDLLSDRAYQHYLAGRSRQAIEVCRDALLVVEPAGDRLTVAYLRYVICLGHSHLGRWREVLTGTDDLLGWLDEGHGPYWRAKVLGLRAEALVQQGHTSAALDCLAEAYGLLTDQPGRGYNHASAHTALSEGLAVGLLLGPAIATMSTATVLLRDRPAAACVAHLARATQEGIQGLLLHLVGDERTGDRAYADCAASALRAEHLAAAASPGMLAHARGMVQFALQRLRVEPVDVGALERALEQCEPLTAQLLRLALASHAGRVGDAVRADALLEQVRAVPPNVGGIVPRWVATAWLAEAAEAARGPTEETRRWRDLATSTLRALLADREHRFEQVLARYRLARASARVARDDDRLWEDPLTGTGNRRMVDAVLADAERAQCPMLFVDVDYLKEVNDRHGHDVGDVVLRRVAGLLQRSCRPGDVVARYGGDEFLVVLAPTGDVHVLAERMASVVAAADWERVAPGLRVSVTVGAATAGPAALARADAAVLAAKAARPLRTGAPSGSAA